MAIVILLLIGDWTEPGLDTVVKANEQKLPPFRSELENRSTPGDTTKICGGFFGKCLNHLILNRNFWDFRMNGKHAVSSCW